jgi:hypothetical protein
MSDTRVTNWVNWSVFAAIVLLVGGLINVFNGLAAIIGPNSAYFLTVEGDLFLFDVAGWGWWHLIVGIAMVLVAIFLYRGATWARVIAIILVIINAIAQFALLPVQPWWSAIAITIDVLVIYALTAHGREIKQMHERP